MGMTSRISSLVTKARAHYSDHGLSGLMWNSILFLANKPIQHRSISRTQLQNIAANGDRIWYTGREKPIKISPPTHETLREAFKSYPKEYNPQRAFVCELEDCHLIGPNAVGVSKDNRLILETIDVISVMHLGSPTQVLKRLIGLRTGSIDNHEATRVFPLISPDPSFYHWMLEYLPRLRLLDHYEKETGYEPTVLIESDSPKFVRDTLELAGYGTSRCEEWTGGEKCVKHLIVPSKRTHAFNYQDPSESNYQPSQTDYYWLRDKIRSNSNQNRSTVDKSSKIYISRQKAPPKRGRKVANYHQFVNELRDQGFTPYILEDLSFQEQVDLFTDADVILGPHGAGFANMIFSNDPLIIEMFPNNIVRPHFYFLSNVMDFEYEGIVTESHKGNLLVDLDLFRDRINEIDI